MSPRRRTRPGDADLADAPFLDDAERAESAWLVARDADPSAPPPSPEIASDYAETLDLLASLAPHAAHASWQEDVLRAAVTATPPVVPWWRRRPAIRWTVAGGLVAAVAALALVLVLGPRPSGELEVAVRPGHEARADDKPRGDARAIVGDRLTITARPSAPGDLRVYRADGKLVASCPGGPSCRSSGDGEYTIEVTLDAPSQYRVILVVGGAGAPAGGTVDAYLDAARASHARVVAYPPIEVE